MNVWDKESFNIMYKGSNYSITRLGLDISEGWSMPRNTVELSHKIESSYLPTTIYMTIDTNENTFGFSYKVIEDGNDVGLFMTLQDVDLFNELSSLIDHIETTYND